MHASHSLESCVERLLPRIYRSAIRIIVKRFEEGNWKLGQGSLVHCNVAAGGVWTLASVHGRNKCKMEGALQIEH